MKSIVHLLLGLLIVSLLKAQDDDQIQINAFEVLAIDSESGSPILNARISVGKIDTFGSRGFQEVGHKQAPEGKALLKVPQNESANLVCVSAYGYYASPQNLPIQPDTNNIKMIFYLKPIESFENIYYDYNSATLRIPESKGDLNRILELLINNHELRLQIKSHTDSRGSNLYNIELSNRRAMSVLRWFANHGVSESRIHAIGFGEISPLIRCNDEVSCSESEHQLNRRTEYQLLTLDGFPFIKSTAR